MSALPNISSVSQHRNHRALCDPNISAACRCAAPTRRQLHPAPARGTFFPAKCELRRSCLIPAIALAGPPPWALVEAAPKPHGRSMRWSSLLRRLVCKRAAGHPSGEGPGQLANCPQHCDKSVFIFLVMICPLLEESRAPRVTPRPWIDGRPREPQSSSS